jgi:hypothetical protein
MLKLYLDLELSKASESDLKMQMELRLLKKDVELQLLKKDVEMELLQKDLETKREFTKVKAEVMAEIEEVNADLSKVNAELNDALLTLKCLTPWDIIGM